MSARNRELLALVPVAVIVAAGFAAVFIVKDNEVSDVSLTYAGYFLGLCLAAHVFLRIRLPYADPYLFPLCALLAAVGLVVIYRIDDKLAFDQASVFVLGLVLFCLTIVLLRDYHVLERYRYLIATAGILLLLAPYITRNPVNGAYLSVDIGPIAFQPAELAKICIVIFLASYLAEKREMLSVAARRVAGADDPAAEALRSAAGGLGRGDADARLHQGPRQLADVLRRLPRAALRRHRALLVRPDRAGDLRHRRLRDRLQRSATSTTASTSGSTRSPRTRPRALGRCSSRCSPRPTAASSARVWENRC